ncbi:MAG: EamA family transporter, partial [Thiohalobacteraceae bacterium]
LFYYVLKRVAASRIALTTLVTPVLALWLGQLLNEETIDAHLWTGAALILGGLAAHQWGDALMARMRAVEVSAEEG